MESIKGLTVIENFITKEQEDEMLKFINEQEWSSTLDRRTQQYNYIYDYKNYTLTKTNKAPAVISDKFSTIFKEDEDTQCIINEYEPGQGISAHTDHQKLFGKKISIISLMSPTTMIFRYGSDSVSVILNPRSLVIMEDDARTKWTHEIPKNKTNLIGGKRVPRSKRISVTMRNVQ